MASLDWLQISAPEDALRGWAEQFRLNPHEQQRQRGFAVTECRDVLGGSAWLSYEPYTASKEWGTSYGHLKLTSDQAGSYGPEVAAQLVESKATRIDVAFDVMAPRWRPWDLTELVRSGRTIEEQRSIDVDGETRETLYVGSKESERRLCIYEKSKQEALLEGGPGDDRNRVEARFKGASAAHLWKVYQGDPKAALLMAAGAVEQLAGLKLSDDAYEFKVPAEPEPSIDETLFAAIQQYGHVLHAAHEAGVDIEGVCAARADGIKRMAQWRIDRFKRQLQVIGVESLHELLLQRVMAAK